MHTARFSLASKVIGDPKVHPPIDPITPVDLCGFRRLLDCNETLQKEILTKAGDGVIPLFAHTFTVPGAPACHSDAENGMIWIEERMVCEWKTWFIQLSRANSMELLASASVSISKSDVYFAIADDNSRFYVTLDSLALTMAQIYVTKSDAAALASQQDTVTATTEWGNETVLLRHLSAAKVEFWTRFDPNDLTTAPTNKQVAVWLVKRGVAKRVAEVMSQILRADELPAGNHKR
jgi:hypothetical protein